MIHRYLATAVGVLITVMALASWFEARRGRATISPWWATATLVWVCAQGAFGALTVTLKLYPAIVTLHLLGGIGLLALLAVQGELALPRPMVLDNGTRRLLLAVAALVLLQVSLGGWVSTNYAVLACSGFPHLPGRVVAGDGLPPRLHAAARSGRNPWRRLPAFRCAHRDPLHAPADGLCRARGLAVAGLATASQRPGRAAQRRLCARRRRAVAAGLAGCPTWCSTGRWWLRWHTRPVPPCSSRCWPCSWSARRLPPFPNTMTADSPAGPPARCCRLRRPPDHVRHPRHPSLHGDLAAFARAPVLRADQAARGAVDRLLRCHRHAAGHAGPARSGAWRWPLPPASGWWLRPLRHSTA